MHDPGGDDARSADDDGSGVDEGFVRVPGLFPAWELEQVVTRGHRYLIDDAGLCDDGTPLFFVFRLEPDDAVGT